jgi:hypothetical protein
MISTIIAYHIVFERHLALPTNKEYADWRVLEIAKRMEAARSELASCERELANLYMEDTARDGSYAD